MPKNGQEVRELIDKFIDWYLLGTRVLERGELARAHALLGILHRYLSWMSRLDEEATEHWATPSRSWEDELSEDAKECLRIASARIDEGELRAAYRESWKWGTKLTARLAKKHHFDYPNNLLGRSMRTCGRESGSGSV